MISTRLLLAVSLTVASLASAAPAPQTPQDFQRVYREALNAQDAAAAKRLFLQRTPGEIATVEVLVANELDAARIAAAAGKAFGIRLVVGGTLVPPLESDQWQLESNLATIPDRRGGHSLYKPLRATPNGYKIDLVAGRMTWMDDPDAAETRARYRPDPGHVELTLRALAEGRYRTIEEFRDVTGGGETLATASDSPLPAPPRPFRRPIKLDLSTPLAALRSNLTAMAEGDGAGWVKAIEVVDPADAPGLKALARRITSVATIAEASAKQFGAAGARIGAPAPLPRERMSALQMLAQLDDFERRPDVATHQLVIRGDQAQWMEDDDAVLQDLVRVNGEWKLRSRLKAEDQERDPEELANWTMIYNMLAQLEEDFAARIARGEFKTAEEAKAAMDKASREPPYTPAARPQEH